MEGSFGQPGAYDYGFIRNCYPETIEGEIHGPVRIEVEGFRAIFDEVLFVDMKPEDGVYEPLIGYVVLEKSQAGADMLGHRLIKIKHVDLK